MGVERRRTMCVYSMKTPTSRRTFSVSDGTDNLDDCAYIRVELPKRLAPAAHQRIDRLFRLLNASDAFSTCCRTCHTRLRRRRSGVGHERQALEAVVGGARVPEPQDALSTVFTRARRRATVSRRAVHDKIVMQQYYDNHATIGALVERVKQR